MAKLEEKQEIVLVGLISGKSRAECAKLAGVAESTIYNWLNEKSFKTKLKDAKARVYDESTAQIYGLASAAIEVLKRGLNGRATSIEVNTAKIVIAHISKLRELELGERIEKLEQIIGAY
jgi:transposase-like protein